MAANTVASDRLDNASDMHGVERVDSGFHITDVVSEYRALRASVVRLWRESLPQPDLNDIDDIIRFDESLDQSLASGVSSYSKRIDESRQMFLAILSHDMRNPLSCIRMAAESSFIRQQRPGHSRDSSIIKSNTASDAVDQRPNRFLIERIGRAMPLNRDPVDLEKLCLEVINLLSHDAPGAHRAIHSEAMSVGLGMRVESVSYIEPDGKRHPTRSSGGAIHLSVTSNGMSSADPNNRSFHRGVDRP